MNQDHQDTRNRYERIDQRVLNSIRSRGLKRSVQSVSDVVEDWRFERKHGLSTKGLIDLTDLEIDSENIQQGKSYMPARVGHLRQVFNALPIDRASWTLVDLGSGKGRVLIAGAELGFGRVIGVEFAADLCRDAEANKAAYETRLGADSGIEIWHTDATTMQIDPEPTVFYAYNPFELDVMTKVVNRIASLQADSGQPVWFCYTNHIASDALDDLPNATRYATVKWGGEETIIWKL